MKDELLIKLGIESFEKHSHTKRGKIPRNTIRDTTNSAEHRNRLIEQYWPQGQYQEEHKSFYKQKKQKFF